MPGRPRGFAGAREKDRVIHGAKPRQIHVPCANSDEGQLDVSRFAKQLGEGAHGARGVALGGKMPERRASPNLKAFCPRGFHKSGDGFFVRGSEVERFIKFPGAS